MKKILLLLLLLPFISFGQTVVDLETWGLTSNGTGSNVQTYVQSGSLIGPSNPSDTPISYSTAGLLTSGWADSSFQNYKYFEISIAPTTGNVIWISNLLFQQAGISNGGNNGPSNYTVKYYVSENGSTLGNFYTQGTTLILEESISSNTSKNVTINQSLASNQKLIIRFYARGGNSWNTDIGWRILANTLKFTGYKLAPLNGTYIIGSVAGAHFPNITAAVSRLNSVGVSGPVTFLLDENQTVISHITINQFTGSSTTNTLTIKPNIEKDITINANMQFNYTGVPSVFLFNGTSNVIIDGSNSLTNTKNLTLINNDNLAHSARSTIWVASNGVTGSSNITVKNSILKFTNRNQDLTLLTGVYCGNNGIVSGDNYINVQPTTATNSNIIIENNEMINVKDAININGNSDVAKSPSGWKIRGNKIGSTIDSQKPVRGMYISNALNYEISGNTISGVRNNLNQTFDRGGVILLGTSSGIVSSNYINNITNTIMDNGEYYTAGIYANSTGITEIYNNMINNLYITSGDSSNDNHYFRKAHGIIIRSGNKTNIFYNTIVMDGAPASTAYASCLYITGGSNINIKNNIFVNSLSNTQYAMFKNGGTISSISNNDYYVTNATGKFLNRIGGISYPADPGATTAPTGWNSAIGDSNSLIFPPIFVSVTDLHLSNGENSMLKAATPISVIITDIDGDTRAAVPYMGADEILCSFLVKWNGSWSSKPTIDSKVVFVKSYNADGKLDENKDIEACSCYVEDNAKVVFNSGYTLKVVNEVKVVAGTLTFENNASLVQMSDEAVNSGKINYHRHTASVKRYDYTYWSSPVQGQTMHDLSPKTFYDKYYSYDNRWVVNKYGTLPMIKGEGYIIRAPQDHEINVAKVDETPVFKGIPNNGKIEKVVEKDKSYLLGNPYPSAINANKFLEDNSTVLQGTLYFWTHNSPPSSAILGDKKYNYTTADYATYNRTGGVGTGTAAEKDPKLNYPVGGVTNFSVPTGNIAAGQGFFAPTKAGGSVVFNNAMRISGGASGTDNAQFFKLSTSSKTTAKAEKSRIWLNLANSEGAFKQALIGYISGATNDYDGAFDGATYDGNIFVDFYSVNNEKNLTIQGRALPFVKKDSVALGYKSTIKGEFQISIDQADGVLAAQNVFLEDKDLKIVHDLKKETYTFSTEKGTFNSRFVLRYADKNAVDEVIVPEVPGQESNAVVMVSVKDGEIKINSTLTKLDKVVVYDAAGRKLFQKNKIDANVLLIPHFVWNHQVLIVDMVLIDGTKHSKKIIN